MSGPHDAVRDAVLRRLDQLDRAAGQADSPTLVRLARTEIVRLADGWRLLLTVHRGDEEGRCRACPGGTRGRWPCQIWRMAHEQLIGEGVPHHRRTRPLRNPLGRALRTMAARRAAEAAARESEVSAAETTIRLPAVHGGLPGPRRR